MAACAASPVEGFRNQTSFSQQRRSQRAWATGRERTAEERAQMLDELCAYIEAEGGILRADRVAQFYQSKPASYKAYFMREGLRNVVSRSERLTWDPRDFILLNLEGKSMTGCAPTSKAARDVAHVVPSADSPLVHAGAYCVVRKHSTMGCAVVGFGNEQLVGCILGEAPHVQISNSWVKVSPHVDANAGTGLATCSLFAAWGPEAEARSPISAKLVGNVFDAMVLNYLSSPLATQMSNPDLACVRSIVHYIAATFPVEREMSVTRVDDFLRHNPEYRPMLHR